MRMALKQMKARKISLGNLYIISLAITMILLLMWKSEPLMQTKLFSDSSLRELQKYLQGNPEGFLFILKERLSIVFSFFILATTSLGSVFVHMNVLWYGMSSGLFLALVLMRYGLKGILLLAAGMFPHYFIYVPSLILILHLSKEKRTINGKFISQLFVITSVVIIGCILECYVNPEIVAKILKKF